MFVVFKGGVLSFGSRLLGSLGALLSFRSISNRGGSRYSGTLGFVLGETRSFKLAKREAASGDNRVALNSDKGLYNILARLSIIPTKGD